MSGNALRVIYPYYDRGIWAFDDEKAGLVREPFVAGVPAMIDTLVREIPRAREGFRLIFSESPFPGYQVRIDLLRSESGGNWYRWEEQNQEGWLCPALFKYFAEAPRAIYCRAEPLDHSSA